MKRTGLQWLAISVLLIAALTASADTRPQYGGTLHISSRVSASSLDPAEMADSGGARNLVSLIFDTLVTVDATGRPQSALAESWQSTPGDRGLEFRLRHNVKFHDGSPLTAEIAASSLRKANPAWNVTAAADVVTIESAGAAPELLQEVALASKCHCKEGCATAMSLEPVPFTLLTGNLANGWWQPRMRIIGMAGPLSMKSMLIWGEIFAIR